jgi:hypothetical protein
MIRNPLPAGIAPALALTLWHGNGLRQATVDGLALLGSNPAIAGDLRGAAARGRLVLQLHAPPRDLNANLARMAALCRRDLPGVRLWAGVAWDGYPGEYADAKSDAARDRIEEVYLGAARVAHAQGFELFVANSEAAGKLHPKAARDLSIDVVDGLRAQCPGMLLGHTAYDHPTYHGEEKGRGADGRPSSIDADDEGYPWSVWVGGEVARAAGARLPKDGRVAIELPQAYAAPPKPKDGGTQPTASIGSLARRLEGAGKSWDTATRLGWVDPLCPIRPYVQAHHVTAVDTCGAVAATDLSCLWAFPSRSDVEGMLAVAVLAAGEAGALTLAGHGLPGWSRAVAAWAQGRLNRDGAGLKVDGAWGKGSTAGAKAWLQRECLPGDGALTDALLSALAG